MFRLDFLLPPKKEVLIFDREGYEVIFNILPKKTKVGILDLRYERINFPILILSLLNLFKPKEMYIINYIKYVSPKLVITHIDNNPLFYQLKKKFKNIKFICIQNARRDKFFLDTLNHNYPQLDYLFCISDSYKKIYSSKLQAKVKAIGTIKNNHIVNKKSNKKGILFVSEHTSSKDDIQNLIGWNYCKHPTEQIKKLEEKKIYGDDYWNLPQEKVIQLIDKFCKEKKIKFTILQRPNNNIIEKNYYHLLKKKYNLNCNFVSGKSFDQSYKICDKHRVVVTIHSTLGYENVARGNKNFFVPIRDNFFNIKIQSFFYPLKNFMKCIYWLDKFNDKNFFYKLEKIYKMKNGTYKKLIKKTNFNLLMSYDKDNKTIKKIILNLLK